MEMLLFSTYEYIYIAIRFTNSSSTVIMYWSMLLHFSIQPQNIHINQQVRRGSSLINYCNIFVYFSIINHWKNGYYALKNTAKVFEAV